MKNRHLAFPVGGTSLGMEAEASLGGEGWVTGLYGLRAAQDLGAQEAGLSLPEAGQAP